MIPSYLVGGRDSEYALEFVDDLRGRLANRVQLTTDGHKPYLQAVEESFGADIDYAMLVKLYGEGPKTEARYSPAAPAMAAGVSKTLWTMDNVVALIDAAAPATTKRGPYKKRGAQESHDICRSIGPAKR